MYFTNLPVEVRVQFPDVVPFPDLPNYFVTVFIRIKLEMSGMGFLASILFCVHLECSFTLVSRYLALSPLHV